MRAGLCEQWTNDWTGNENRQQLIEKYLSGIDFSMGSDWLPKEFIKEHFDKALLNANGIYVDDFVTVPDMKRVVLLGRCNAELRYNLMSVGDVYCCDETELHLYANDASFVTVEQYGKSLVKGFGRSIHKVVIYRHGDGEVAMSGNYRVRDKIRNQE